MAIKVRSRREKIGSGLGLVMGLIAFNLIAPLFLESKEISDMNRMIGAMVSALICSELGPESASGSIPESRPNPQNRGQHGPPSFVV